MKYINSLKEIGNEISFKEKALKNILPLTALGFILFVDFKGLFVFLIFSFYFFIKQKVSQNEKDKSNEDFEKRHKSKIENKPTFYFEFDRIQEEIKE